MIEELVLIELETAETLKDLRLKTNLETTIELNKNLKSTRKMRKKAIRMKITNSKKISIKVVINWKSNIISSKILNNEETSNRNSLFRRKKAKMQISITISLN